MAQSLSDSPRHPADRPRIAPVRSIIGSPSFAVRHGDKIYSAVTFFAALSIFAIIVSIAWNLTAASRLSIHRYGLSFISGSVWDETRDIYGILPFVFGTLYSSFLALLMAVPVSIG